jgi:UDP-N-acetylglucosamine 2-epimerase (non-hydrolysing)
MTVFGTRPEAIKMAPVVLELTKYPKLITPIVTVTAQHREMLDQVLGLFSITPEYDLDIMARGQTLFDITARAMHGLDAVMAKENPDIVLVHGDTTTTFAGALTAYYHHIAVGHVEAGLRTGDKYSPFPEEMNRKLTSSLADFHFAPTNQARQNLLQENVNEDQVFVTGNTVIDALKATVKAQYVFADPMLAAINYNQSRVVLITTHRRENLGEPMRHVYQALRDIVDTFSDVEVVFPVHKNPKVREVVEAELGHLERIHLIDPMEYEPFANLLARSYLILTDSGGIQEEAPALGKPVLVLRDTTERPEAIASGTVKLIGTEKNQVFAETKLLLENRKAYELMAGACNPYGDGQASHRIVQTLLHRYGLSTVKPEPFLC